MRQTIEEKWHEQAEALKREAERLPKASSAKICCARRAG